MSEKESTNNKRIAKNTLFLYIRMIIMMAVTLYTTRIVLKVLGVEDFGLYNVISGVVVMFSFLNTALISATQRFLNISIAKEKNEEAQKVFALSIVINAILALFILFLGETIGLHYVHNTLSIPDGRENAAFWTYEIALINTLVLLFRTPYNAAIIAYENMNFYAYISILEAFLKLIILIPLIYSSFDHLILYSILMFITAVIVTSIYVVFCVRKFSICKFHFTWDKKLFHEMFNFSGWSVLGTFSDMSAVYGLNAVINFFLSVTVNAAFGIAMQLVNAINLLAGNFQMAFRPQITKHYARKDEQAFLTLVFRSSRFSYYLLLLVAVPFITGCDEILDIWLGSPPIYASDFCAIYLCAIMIDAISAPLWMSAQAVGNIRSYQIMISLSILSIIPISYIMLLHGLSPIYVIVAKVLTNLNSHILRIIYLNKRIHFPVFRYMSEVMSPIILSTIIVSIIIWILPLIWPSIPFYSHMLIGAIVTGITIYYIGISYNERQFIKSFVYKFTNKQFRST